MPTKKANNGCGCASIPFSLILVMLGAGYWGFGHLGSLDISKFLPSNQQPTASNSTTVPSPRFPVANSMVARCITLWENSIVTCPMRSHLLQNRA